MSANYPSEHGLRAYVFPHEDTYAARLGIEVKVTRMLVGPGMRNRMLTLEQIAQLRFQSPLADDAGVVRRA